MTQESRVVQPDTERLDISNGDWLLVKKRLSAGDQQDGFERSYLKNPDGSYVVGVDNRLIVSPANARMSLITSFLVDWSLIGIDGKPLDIRGVSIQMIESMLRALDPDSFKEIYEAINSHDEKEALARAAKKKIQGGAPALNKISPSPDDSAGVTNGSENLIATSTT